MSVQPAPVRPALDRRSSTVPKRTSLLPKPSSIVLDASVLIAQHVQLTGTYAITISSNSILHPHCKVSSAMAPILIGEGCVIHEKAKIGLGMSAELDAESKRNSMASVRSSTTSIRDSIGRDGVVLGRYVVVESNAVVEASEIGEGTVIEVGAVIGRGCIIGKVKDFSEIVGFVGELTECSTVPSLLLRLFQQTHVCPITLLCSVALNAASTGHRKCGPKFWTPKWLFMRSN